MLTLKKPLVVFDLETTGTSVTNDRIVELAVIKLHVNGTSEERQYLINPEIPIPAEATAIHGIRNEDVADKPTFKQLAQEIARFFTGCDIAGFNSNKFDFPLLVEEFLRAGVDFDSEGRRFIDAQRIYHVFEPRTLSAAYKFYCDKDLVNAHSAMADTKATLEILLAQLKKYPQLNQNLDEAHKLSGQDKLVDLAGRMLLNEQGEPIFNFGKHKGKTVKSVLASEPAYYQWIMDNDFPLDTKRKLTKIKMGI
jgi:DNA polymerase-3 subunit epsilon